MVADRSQLLHVISSYLDKKTV